MKFATIGAVLWILTVGAFSLENYPPPQSYNVDSFNRTRMSRTRRALSSYSFARDNIPGTDLKTGTFYVLSMKKFPLGFVSWSTRKHDSGYNYVFVDNVAAHRPKYRKGGEWHRDTHWAFLSSSEPGWYHLINRAIPCQYATWSESEIIEAESTFYMTLDPNYPGTHAEQDFLFKPDYPPSEIVDRPYYQLKVKSMPHAVISWNAGNSSNQAYYIHVETTDNQDWLKRYSWGHIWYDDTLFHFEEVNDQQEEQRYVEEEDIVETEINSMSHFDTLVGQVGYGYSLANIVYGNAMVVCISIIVIASAFTTLF